MAALLLGYDVNTSKPRRARRDRRADQPELRGSLRGVLLRRLNNMISGDAWIHHRWSGDFLYLPRAKNPNQFGFEVRQGRNARSTPTAYAIPSNAAHPGTALLFIDYMLRPENVIKNINYIGYPLPVKGTESAYESLVVHVAAVRGDRRRPEQRDHVPQRYASRRAGPRRCVDRRAGGLRHDLVDCLNGADVIGSTQGPNVTGQAREPAVAAAGLARHGLDVGVLHLASLLLLLALSFGTSDLLGNPRFGTSLANYQGAR